MVFLIFVGVLVLGWEIRELLYCRFRYNFWMPLYENVLGFGWYIYGFQVKLLHIFRFIIGTTFILMGVLL